MALTPSLDQMLTALILREGPFSHLAADRGGATRWGITQTTLAAWRGVPVSVEDVQTLSQDEARAIFTALYFERPQIDHLPPALQPLLLDFAVNSGPHVAIRALQETLGITADGVCGPVTQAAAFASALPSTLQRLCGWRVMMLARIVRRDPSQLTFLSGWLSRALSFLPEVS